MDRITQTNLKALVRRMELALGIPEGPTWTRDERGHLHARVGALVLNPGSATYGNAWTISQLMNEGGGENTLLRGTTARELWYRAQAWLDGYDASTRRPGYIVRNIGERAP